MRWMGGRLRYEMEINKINRKWTLCEYKVIIMSMQTKTNVEEQQSEGLHLRLQEEVLELSLDLIVGTTTGTWLLFVAICIACVGDH